MGFTSKLYPGELIINDSTPDEVVMANFEGMGRGLNLDERTAEGYAGAADAFPKELLIPRSEWQARIEEMEERKTRLSDIVNAAGLPCKDQAQTNYCWVNSPTHCMEIQRVVQGQEMVILSPASAGAPIKDFSNVGGWGKQALQWIADNGLVPVDKWPANAIDRKYYTEENKALALNYRAIEWTECRPRDIDEMISSLLRRWPGAKGLNWWHHEVTTYEAVWLDGTIATRERNSWGASYGTNGYFILQGSKMVPDDYVCLRQALPS